MAPKERKQLARLAIYCCRINCTLWSELVALGKRVISQIRPSTLYRRLAVGAASGRKLQ